MWGKHVMEAVREQKKSSHELYGYRCRCLLLAMLCLVVKTTIRARLLKKTTCLGLPSFTEHEYEISSLFRREAPDSRASHTPRQCGLSAQHDQRREHRGSLIVDGEWRRRGMLNCCAGRCYGTLCARLMSWKVKNASCQHGNSLLVLAPF